MGFSLGFAGGGAADALKDILQQRALQQELAERHRSNMAEEALKSRQIDLEGGNQSLLRQLQVAEFQDRLAQEANARGEQAANNVQESLSIGDHATEQQAGILKARQRAGLLRAKPIDVANGIPQQSGVGQNVTGDAVNADPALTGLQDYTYVGTGKEQRQAARDAATDTKNDATAARADAAATLAATVAANNNRHMLASEAAQAATVAATNRRLDDAEKKASAAQQTADAAKAAQQNEVQDSIDLVDQIKRDPALASAVGPLDQYVGGYISGDPTGVTRFRALTDQLISKLSLAQAGKLKGQGQVSDKERAMLAAAASSIRYGMSEGDFRNALDTIGQQFKRMQGGGAAPATPSTTGGGELVFNPKTGKLEPQ